MVKYTLIVPCIRHGKNLTITITPFIGMSPRPRLRLGKDPRPGPVREVCISPFTQQIHPRVGHRTRVRETQHGGENHPVVVGCRKGRRGNGFEQKMARNLKVEGDKNPLKLEIFIGKERKNNIIWSGSKCLIFGGF